jgi:hypothetical protein
MDAEQLGGDTQVMSHAQAYHTSCREGLGGHSGFQFNAASPRIAANLLTALASAHAGYQAPRDYPLEPTPEQLRDFPIALKFCPVDGVPVISQTAYVGREFRGRNGEPDTGRFGNYFTHIVLGGPDAADPFDGLLPIELWRAHHWCTSESSTRELPELSALAAGACDLEWALATLASHREWLAPVLDAVLFALHDGPRLVLVETDTERAAAWVAWVSYALPPDLAPRLSFSTFDGQPRHARELHMCVTTPGVDVGFAEYELGRDVTMLQPLIGKAPPASSLYARVAGTLLADGAENVLRASRAVGAGTLPRRGAELAVVSGRVALARDPDDVVAVLELLADATARGEWSVARAITAELPEEDLDEGVIRGWSRVHTVARDGTNEAAREIADAALARLLPALASMPEDLPELPSDAPTTPSPGCLASWLETVEQSHGGAQRATLLWGGARLGLIGCNVALDRQVAAAICAGISDPEVAEVFALLADEHRYTGIVEDVVSSLARDAFGDQRALPLLRDALAHPSLRDTVDAFALRATDFDERAVWERLRVEADPSVIHDSLLALIPIAQSQQHDSDVKTIFGASGPRELGDYVTMLGAYAKLRALPSREDMLGALRVLGTFPLADADARELFEILIAVLPEDWEVHPVFRAWCAASTPAAAGFAEWSQWVTDAVVGTPSLSAQRRSELEQVAGDACASWLDMSDETLARARQRDHVRASPPAPRNLDRDYREGVLKLADAFAHDWPRVAAQGLRGRLSKSQNPSWLIAHAFLKWQWLGRDAGDLLETALPEALRRTNARRLEAVEEMLGAREREDWLDWLERHPPREGIARSVSRLLRWDEPQQ